MARRASKGDAASAELVEYVDPAVTLKPRKMAIATRELKKILDEEGVLTAERVLEAATVEDHPLHSWFEWDDSAAAHRYRLNQARAIIIAARIVYERKDQKHAEAGKLRLRRFLSRGVRQGFGERAAAIGEEEVRQNLVRTRLRAIQSAVRELADVRALDEFRERINAEVEGAAEEMKVEL